MCRHLIISATSCNFWVKTYGKIQICFLDNFWHVVTLLHKNSNDRRTQRYWMMKNNEQTNTIAIAKTKETVEAHVILSFQFAKYKNWKKNSDNNLSQYFQQYNIEQSPQYKFQYNTWMFIGPWIIRHHRSDCNIIRDHRIVRPINTMMISWGLNTLYLVVTLFTKNSQSYFLWIQNIQYNVLSSNAKCSFI